MTNAYTSDTSKLPPDVRAMVKALLAQSPRSPYDAVLKVFFEDRSSVDNPIDALMKERCISEIDVALALDCTMHEAAMLRAAGWLLSNRQTILVLALLRDVQPSGQSILQAAKIWYGGSYISHAFARLVAELGRRSEAGVR